MKGIFTLIITVILTTHLANGQTNLVDVFTKLVSPSSDTIVTVEHIDEIVADSRVSPLFDEGIDFYLKKTIKDLEVIDNRIVIRKTLRLYGIPLDRFIYWFKDFHFTKPVIIDNPNEEYAGMINFDNCVFEKGLFFHGNFKSARIQKSQISSCFSWHSDKASALYIDSTLFQFDAKQNWLGFKLENQMDLIVADRNFITEPQVDTLKKYRNQFVRQDFVLSLNHIESLQISQNTFKAPHDLISIASFETKACRDFIFTGNSTNQLVDMNAMVVTNSLTVVDNIFNGHITLSSMEFPPFMNKIKFLWSQLDGNKLVIIEGKKKFELGGTSYDAIYAASTADELMNTNSFVEFTGSYQSLLNVYKLNGDLVSVNGCFSELKDVQGTRLKNEFEVKGGFNNYFSWKINRLLKFYSNHGTDPALAVVTSIYIILAFAVFYFFFPSDWDVTSKSQLVSNFRDFVTRNEQGYIRPFLKVVLGFIISLTNAIALSLNAFTTLGFGNIPTHGLARYICIVQGFMGWFLLSIFTVALFNQVSV